MSGLLKACNGGGDAPIDLTENLVAHYLLNNNTDDSHGIYDGTPSGGVDFQGDVAEFDGVDDYIDVGSVEFKTISLWVKLDAVRSANSDIILDHATSFDNFRLIRWYDSLNATRFYYGTSYYDLPSPDANVLGMTHLVLTSNGDMYRNGILLHLDTEVCTVHLKHIGASNALSPAYYAKGIITNVRVYNDKKDQSFVTALFEEGYYPKLLPLPTTDGLIAHYPLTGTAEDSHDVYDGTEVGNTYLDDAEFGSVASFDGVNDYIDVRSPTNWQYQNLSFSMWGKVDSTGAWSVLLDNNARFSANGSTSNSGNGISISADGKFELIWVLLNGEGTQTYTYGTGGYIISCRATTIVSTDTWYHVVGTLENGNIGRIYINGTLEATETSNASVRYDISFDVNNGIGCNTADPNNGKFYDGKVKDTRIYNKVLAQQEITDIYNYEKNFRPIDIDDGLVAYYPLANNSLDNYYNEYDGVDSAMTYDGLSGVFNGVSSNVSLGNLTSTVLNSISFIVNIKSDKANSILSQRVYFGHQLIIGIREGGFVNVYHTVYENFTDEVTFTTALNIDTIYHIAIVYDGTNLNLFINGELDESIALANSLFIGNTTPTFLGYGDYDVASLWRTYADIDLSRLRIYNKAITAEQVEVIYNTEKGDFI